MFQTSTVNSSTNINAIPNGSGTASRFQAFSSSDATNFSSASFSVEGTSDVRVISGAAGTGTFLPMTFYTGGSERVRVDTSGNVLVTSAAGLGYGTGAGGTVTQATSKSTAVTLNKPTGQITMNNAALGAGASVNFQLSNSLLAASDSIVVQPSFGANSQTYTAQATFCGSGAAYIRVTNTSGGSLSEAVTLNFAIIKGATA
jgi:hypothetical protein